MGRVLEMVTAARGEVRTVSILAGDVGRMLKIETPARLQVRRLLILAGNAA